ncbi:MAG: dihydropteroate synthase, partial [Glaciihabitans sp.]|nr:dihydropteroate synthase [Glaciihabitans sp.]
LSDAEMYRVVAATGVKYIAMHWRGHGEQMQANASYRDVVSDVHRELTIRVAEAIVWGVDPSNILIDPGLGFAKTAEHNWQLLNALPSFVELGFPVLIGASRKAFLKEFAAEGAAPQERDEATATISALSAQAGAWGVRVHNIPATRRVLDVWDRWNGAGA